MKFKDIIKHLKKYGKSKNQPDLKYNKEQLRMGIDVEYEHTPSKDASKEIAKDHLEEIPDYYTKLKEMERKAEKELKALGREEYMKKFLGKNK